MSRWTLTLWLLGTAMAALTLVACTRDSGPATVATAASAVATEPTTVKNVATPAGGPRFALLPPGAALPDEATCAARVRRSAWEPRPENEAANRTIPRDLNLGEWEGFDARANREILPRITGDFTGTTDEILQWVACKWGLDEDLVRAVAAQESDWRQAATGDVEDDPAHCAPGYSAPCPTSFGITQVRWYVWPGTFPHARDSTPFAADYWAGQLRACYEGYADWLHEFTDSYRAGDEWGCVGLWYAGRWRTPNADDYVSQVRRRLTVREWVTPSFNGR